MRTVGFWLLATSSVVVAGVASRSQAQPAAPMAAGATAGSAAAPATRASEAVMLGAAPSADAKAAPAAPHAEAKPAPATPRPADTKTVAVAARPTSASVKAGVDAWQRGAYAEAVADWQPLAEKGDPDAEFNLAQAYKLGRGVPVDLVHARALYAKAAAQGHAEAQANLGIIMFQSGERAKSMPYIVKAARAGDARAQYIYGTALFNGDIVKKDWTRAYAMMTRAASSGLAQASESIGKMDNYISVEQRQKAIALASSGVDLTKESAIAEPAAAKPAAAEKLASAKPLRQPAPVKPAATPAPAKPTPAAKPVMIARAAPPLKRAPAPRPASAAKPAPVVSGHGWYVQLGAYSSRGAAAAAWGAARGKVRALAGLSPSFGQAGKMTRLRAGPVADRAAAIGLCSAAARAGQACFPVAP